MVKKIVSLTLVLGMIFIGFSQNTEPQQNKRNWNPEKRATMKVERFSKTIELSEEKQEKLFQVLVESQEKRRALKAKEEVSKEERIALRDEHKKKTSIRFRN
jgi:hypothetical protein